MSTAAGDPTPRPDPDDVGFDATWPALDATPGWLTRDQARVLWDAVRSAAGSPVVVEIGSHQGRSTGVLAAARPDVRVIAVDPFVTTRRYAGPSVRGRLERTLARLGVEERVTVRAVRSREALAGWRTPVDVLFVDGKHDAVSLVSDLRWARHVRPGGRVLVHDAFSSVGVTLGLLARVMPGRDLAYEGRTGSLAAFRVAAPRPRDRARMLAELPWWLRNVVVKVLLRARAPRLASRLGHHGPDDPF